MQKIIIQGAKVSDLIDINNPPMILEGENILVHFQKPHSANEIFINSHGGPVTKKQLFDNLAINDSMSEENKKTFISKCFNQHDNSDSLDNSPAHLSVDLFGVNSTCLINPLLSEL